MEQVINNINLDGAMAKAYSELLKELWNGNNNYLSPWDFRQIFIRFAKQVLKFLFLVCWVYSARFTRNVNICSGWTS